MITIHDLHLEALRSAGTTPRSALALRRFGMNRFKHILHNICEDLVIQGDLFDSHTVPISAVIEVMQLLTEWLNRGHRLILMPGNHDLSTDSSKMSSFQALGKLLDGHPNVTYLNGGGWVDEALGVYGISHVPNQDLFDMELAKVPKCRYLLVHCNYDNDFAKEADHSLNLSAEQLNTIPADVVYFAHEHYYREDRRGKVFIGGNQFPMSISDCLHKEMKCMHRLGAKGIERIETWSESDYAELDWRSPEATDARFIRFIGTATQEEAPAMLDIVNRYRRASEAFIITSAVKIMSSDGTEELVLSSTEDLKAFDVMAALKPMFEADEYAILESIHNGAKP